jgi:hypothetical protein
LAHPSEIPEDAPATARSVVAGTGNIVIQIIGDGNTVVAGARYLTLTRTSAAGCQRSMPARPRRPSSPLTRFPSR